VTAPRPPAAGPARSTPDCGCARPATKPGDRAADHGELADLAARVAGDAAPVLRNARRALPTGTGQLRRAIDDLARTLRRTAIVVAQTRSRLAGVRTDSTSRRGLQRLSGLERIVTVEQFVEQAQSP
jgi:hypothetical protein